MIKALSNELIDQILRNHPQLLSLNLSNNGNTIVIVIYYRD
jgi:hypothetical protein